MKFNPKSEEQLVRESLLEAGTYDFEVIEAKDATSKNGNEMISLNMKVFRHDDGFIHVRDYLLESMAFKLIHFCATTGLTAKYEAGTLVAEDCQGVAGKVILKVEEQVGYPPKNVVKDYAKPKTAAAGVVPERIASNRTVVHSPAPARPQAETVPPARRVPAPSAGEDDEPPF